MRTDQMTQFQRNYTHSSGRAHSIMIDLTNCLRNAQNFWVGYSHQTRKLMQQTTNDEKHHIHSISNRVLCAQQQQQQPNVKKVHIAIITTNFMLLMTLLCGKNALCVWVHLVKFEKWSPNINAIRKSMRILLLDVNIFGPPQRAFTSHVKMK